MARRRGNGEGSIFQRADGRWCVTLPLGYNDTGKRQRRTVYSRTKAEALQQLLEAQNRAVSGKLMAPSQMTVYDYLKTWIEDTVRTSSEKSTYALYEVIVRTKINPTIGGLRISKVEPLHIQRMLSALDKQGATARTRQVVLQVAKRAFRDAVRMRIIPYNPASEIERPKHRTREMSVLTFEQVAKLLETVRNDRLFALYVLAVTTGMRQGELLGLQWQDIDFIDGSLRVVRQLGDVRGELYFTEPKTKRGKRYISLPQVAVAALREHLMDLGREPKPSEIVFTDTHGGPIRRSSLRRNWFHPALKRAELPMIRFHDLRHTAATLLLAQNLNPKIVQERLGHTQIATTIDIYGHVIPSMQKEASDRLDHLFAGEKTQYWLQNGYSKRGKPAPPEGAGPVSQRNHGGGFGRAGGIRTLDLLLPKQARYQLRYSPFEFCSDRPENPARCPQSGPAATRPAL